MAPHLDFTSYLQGKEFSRTPSNSFMQFLPVRKQAVSLEQKLEPKEHNDFHKLPQVCPKHRSEIFKIKLF
jgi:hypothetical protein